jgi:hypothetical protein
VESGVRILLALIFIAFSILLLRFMTKFKWIVLVVYIAAGGILRHRGLTPLRKCYDSYISTMNRVDTFLVCTYNPYNSIYFGRA